MRRLRVALLAGAALIGFGGDAPAQGEPPAPQALGVQLRAGLHPGFTRLVFDWHEPVAYRVTQQGEAAEIRFDQPVRFEAGALGRPVRNLRTAQALPDGLILALRPGVRVRHMTVGTRVVLDLLDAPAATSAEAPQAPVAPADPPASSRPAEPTPAATAVPVATPAVPPPLPVAQTAPVPPPPAPIASAVAAPAAAAAAAPAPAATPPGLAEAPAPQVRLPFAGTAAAVQRGGALLLVFDDPRPFDVAALRAAHPALAEAERVPVPGAAVLRLPGDTPRALHHDADGWRLVGGGAATGVAPAREEEGRLLLPVERAGRVITLPDPETDGLIFVGTLAGPGRAVPEQRRFVGFDLIPTRLGVAMVPRADEAVMRSVPEGFVVPLGSGALALRPQQAEAERAAAEVPRLLRLPVLSPEALAARRVELMAALAAAPAGSRGPARLELAETLLALGLGLEAQALARLAVIDDPRLAAQPRLLMLVAAGTLLAGRIEEAAGLLADQRLPARGEAALWRGLAAEHAPPDAAMVEAAPLARLYPAPLRARVLPALAAALAEGGAADAAAELLSDAEMAALPLARYAQARLLEQAGQREAALAAHAALAGSRDRDARARALGRAAELRLALGQADAAAAAAALEAAIPAWRGDRRELARRLRAAELHLEARQPARALALLRETEAAFPEATGETGPAMDGIVRGMVADPATPALTAARLLAERAEAVPAGAQLDTVATQLAERLLRLELPEDAVRLLRLALPRSATPQLLGVAIGEALLAAAEPGAALAALREAGQAELPPDARTRHGLATADALRRLGDAEGAARTLRALGPDGAGPLSELLGAAQDWAGAAAALREHLARLPPAPAPLAPEARQALVRLGAFLALAGDEPGLAALRAGYGARMAGGPLGDAFAALVSGRPAPAELARLGRDIAAMPR